MTRVRFLSSRYVDNGCTQGSNIPNYQQFTSMSFLEFLSNMTNLYQPLNFTVNSYPKAFLKRMFAEWFATQISEVKWIIGFYNEMASKQGKNLILKGWEKSGITNAIKMGSSKLSYLNPLDELDPLGQDQDKYYLIAALSISEDCLGDGIT